MALASSYGVLPKEHKPVIDHAHYNGFASHYFLYKKQHLKVISIPQAFQIYASERQADEGFKLEMRNRLNPPHYWVSSTGQRPSISEAEHAQSTISSLSKVSTKPEEFTFLRGDLACMAADSNLPGSKVDGFIGRADRLLLAG